MQVCNKKRRAAYPPRALEIRRIHFFFAGAAGAADVTFVKVDSRSDIHVLPPSVDDSYLSVYSVLETSLMVMRLFIGLPSIIISDVQVQVSPLTVPLVTI